MICNNNYATCACGVAILAGKDVFMINRCGSINYLGFTHCGDGGILQVVRINDYAYDVSVFYFVISVFKVNGSVMWDL